VVGTLVTWWLGSRSRALTAVAAALVTATSLGLLLSMSPGVFDGQAVLEFQPWVPEIG
jgi:multicomponent K+:H+ antiporter subunit A